MAPFLARTLKRRASSAAARGWHLGRRRFRLGSLHAEADDHRSGLADILGFRWLRRGLLRLAYAAVVGDRVAAFCSHHLLVDFVDFVGLQNHITLILFSFQVNNNFRSLSGYLHQGFCWAHHSCRPGQIRAPHIVSTSCY